MIRLNFPAPSYWKNWAWSLQAAGSLAYFPHWRLGAPSACGPLNARIFAVNLAEVTLATPIAFIIFTVVRTWPHATMTHASVPAEKRRELGISDGLVRISAGLEDVEDLTDDLTQALDRV